MVQEDYGARVGISSLDVGWKVLALFGRVGDGIHKKLADVAADLVGKLKYVLETCSNRNPACSADAFWDGLSILGKHHRIQCRSHLSACGGGSRISFSKP